MKPEKFFAAASLTLGALLCALTPPFGVPDEPAHLFRAFSISEGRLLMAGGGAEVPRSYVATAAAALRAIRGPNGRRVRPALLGELARIPLAPRDRVFVPVPAATWLEPLKYTAGGYTPIGYFPAAAAIAASRTAGAPPLVHLYAARVANLVATTLLIALAISRAPFGRWTLALSALIPMSLYLRSSASVDALTIALAYIAIAEALRVAFDERAGVGALFAASFCAAAVKPGYALIPFMVLVRPRRRTVLVALAAVIAGTLTAQFWASHAIAIGTDSALHIDPRARFTAILHHPATLAGQFVADAASTLTVRLTELAGTFGWLDAPAPLCFALFYFAALGAIALLDGPPPAGFTLWRRLVPLVLFFGTVVLITVATHLFTQPPKFAAMQGRYFLPALPLAFLPLVTREAPQRTMTLAAWVVVGIGFAQTVWIELTRFYL